MQPEHDVPARVGIQENVEVVGKHVDVKSCTSMQVYTVIHRALVFRIHEKCIDLELGGVLVDCRHE